MWHDPASNVLVYNEPDNARILKHVAEAKQLFNGYVGVPATLSNMQILRLLGYPVVRPLERYDWPRSSHIKQPFHAQTETANFLAVHPRACVLSDMGTGKTLASLWAADALMRDAERRGRKLRCLVVAPLSTLSTVWSDALFQNFLGRRTAVVLHGSADKRLELLARPYDFYLLNHDGIKSGHGWTPAVVSSLAASRLHWPTAPTSNLSSSTKWVPSGITARCDLGWPRAC